MYSDFLRKCLLGDSIFDRSDASKITKYIFELKKSKILVYTGPKSWPKTFVFDVEKNFRKRWFLVFINRNILAISYGTFLKTENEYFRTAKSMINLYRPDSIFSGQILGYNDRDGLHPELGVHLRIICVRKRRLDFDRQGFHRSWEAKSDTISRKQQYKMHLSAKQAAVSTARCAPLPTRARLRHHHEPMGSDRDGIDYESLATLLAVAIAAFSKRNQKLVSSRTRAVTA